jgi:TonB family protein
MHALLITLAVLATRPAAEAAAGTAPDTTMVLLAAPLAMRPPPPQERPPDAVYSVLNLPAPPKGFKTIVAPVNVPTEIPPVDLSERFDPRDFSGVGVEGGAFEGLVGGVDPNATGDVIPEYLADEPPERLSGPSLKYPELLRQTGIEGFVVVGFIVDTTGRAEPESIVVLGTTEVGFNFAATDLVRRSRYRPGRVRGKLVRTRATLRVEFNLVERGE